MMMMVMMVMMGRHPPVDDDDGDDGDDGQAPSLKTLQSSWPSTCLLRKSRGANTDINIVFDFSENIFLRNCELLCFL